MQGLKQGFAPGFAHCGDGWIRVQNESRIESIDSHSHRFEHQGLGHRTCGLARFHEARTRDSRASVCGPA